MGLQTQQKNKAYQSISDDVRFVSRAHNLLTLPQDIFTPRISKLVHLRFRSLGGNTITAGEVLASLPILVLWKRGNRIYI